VRNLGECLEVRHIIPRVANALNIDGLGAFIYCGGKVLGLIAVDELGLDTKARE
jgi:hypothetical protein